MLHANPHTLVTLAVCSSNRARVTEGALPDVDTCLRPVKWPQSHACATRLEGNNACSACHLCPGFLHATHQRPPPLPYICSNACALHLHRGLRSAGPAQPPLTKTARAYSCTWLETTKQDARFGGSFAPAASSTACTRGALPRAPRSLPQAWPRLATSSHGTHWLSSASRGADLSKHSTSSACSPSMPCSATVGGAPHASAQAATLLARSGMRCVALQPLLGAPACSRCLFHTCCSRGSIEP